METEGSPQPVEPVRVNRTPTKDNLTSVSHGQFKSGINNKEADISPVHRSTECGNKGSNICLDKEDIEVECEANVRLETDAKDIAPTAVSDVAITETGSEEERVEQMDSSNENVPNASSSSDTSDDKCEGTDEIQLQTVEEEFISEESLSSNSSENKISADSIEHCAHSEINVNEDVSRSDEYKVDVIMTNSTANNNKKNKELSKKDKLTNKKNTQIMHRNIVSGVLIISDSVQKEQPPVQEAIPAAVAPPEKKVKKVVRQKSKPAPPPSPPVKKINRDECDWDSLFDDNGDCLDPTLIEEASIYQV